MSQIKDFILQLLQEKNATDINCIKLGAQTPIADYMIFASGRSSKNIQSIAEYIALELKHQMQWSTTIEGAKSNNWILLDASTVIVHLFHPESRNTIDVEKLWTKKTEKE